MKKPLCLILFLSLLAVPVAHPQGILFPILAQKSRACTSTISLVTGQFVGGTVSNPFALPNNPAAGNLVVVVMAHQGVTSTDPASVLDSNSNAYVKTTNSPATSTAGGQWIYYLQDAPANATKTITVTGGTATLFFAAEFTGTAASAFSADVNNNGGNTSSTNINSPTLTPAANGYLLVSGVYGIGGGNISAYTSPWNALGTALFQWAAEYTIQTTATAQAVGYTQTVSGDWIANEAAFKCQ